MATYFSLQVYLAGRKIRTNSNMNTLVLTTVSCFEDALPKDLHDARGAGIVLQPNSPLPGLLPA